VGSGCRVKRSRCQLYAFHELLNIEKRYIKRILPMKDGVISAAPPPILPPQILAAGEVKSMVFCREICQNKEEKILGLTDPLAELEGRVR
jgi:hypothetical protein